MRSTAKFEWRKKINDAEYVIYADEYEDLEAAITKIDSDPFIETEIINEKVEPAQPVPTEEVENYCTLHKTQMKPRKGGEFYSHSMKSGDKWIYCSGKGYNS